MPILVTPGRLDQQADFYHRLATLTAAGIGLLSSIQSIRGTPPASSWRRVLSEIERRLEQGTTFHESLQSHPDWFPKFDVALVEAGEVSGRLDQVFKLLSDYHESRARLARAIMGQMIYPLLVLHMAVFVFPTSVLGALVWKSDVAGFVTQKAMVLAPLYLVVAALVVLVQSGRRLGLETLFETVLHATPWLNRAHQELVLARLSAALEALINAGVTIVEAWTLAAAASGSPRMKRLVAGWQPRLAAGVTPAELVSESRVFPDMFASSYRTAEDAGKLDENLRRLHRLYQDAAMRRMQTLAEWVPRLLYLVIVLLVAWQIVSFYTDYFGQIADVMK